MIGLSFFWEGRTIPLLLGPSRRRRCIDHVRQALGMSERRACHTLGQHRSTQRKAPCGAPDEERLTEDIIEPARGIWEMLSRSENYRGPVLIGA
jgi:hypothetical protein